MPGRQRIHRKINYHRFYLILNKMKIKSIIYIAIFIILSQGTLAWGQVSDEKWDLMLIREDKVFPTMTDEYEMTLMDIKDYLSENKVKDFNYFTHMQDDYFFTRVMPIHRLSDLKNGIHEYVEKKIKDPEFTLLTEYLNEAIASYRYYIVQYKRDLSFVPEGDNWAEGSPYRKWSYYYFQPGTEDEVESVLAAYKQLYSEKGAKMGFRVFKGFIGIEQPVYLLNTWAEDPLDYHQNLQEVSEILGEEGIALWSKMIGYAYEVDAVEGWYLPQYSVTSGLKMAE